MQTFLPYPNFKKSAEVLDRQRLGKQRVEAMQILNALIGKSLGWINHPATKMWRGHESALIVYAQSMICEWTGRGYKNNISFVWPSEELISPEMPLWFGDKTFHASHRSNLLRKDPIHYGKFDWNEPSDLPYIWPVR